MKMVKCYRGTLLCERKNNIKQMWIIRPNACALPHVPETIFRDGNGGKSKSRKVEIQGPSELGDRGRSPLKLETFSKPKV